MRDDILERISIKDKNEARSFFNDTLLAITDIIFYDSDLHPKFDNEYTYDFENLFEMIEKLHNMRRAFDYVFEKAQAITEENESSN